MPDDDGFQIKTTGGRTVWIDDYRCGACGKTRELALGNGESAERCECGGVLEIAINKPKNWEFKVTKSDKRIIWSDKQVESSHGKGWRETSKRPFMEGGAGERQVYDRGAARYRPVG